jgi:hypothetical protein
MLKFVLSERDAVITGLQLLLQGIHTARKQA